MTKRQCRPEIAQEGNSDLGDEAQGRQKPPYRSGDRVSHLGKTGAL